MPTFFGLTDEYIENIYEAFFFLKYAGGWSFSEAYNLPVGLRTWFIQRLSKQLEEIFIIQNNSKSLSIQSIGEGLLVGNSTNLFNHKYELEKY